MNQLTQDEIDSLVEQMIEEFGQEYIDFLEVEKEKEN